MRFETTASFVADHRRLKAAERALFADAVRSFSAACDRRMEDPAAAFPAEPRVKKVQGTRAVSEMTWSFSGPDGRATFEWISIEVDGAKKLAVRWRRIGGHRIFGAP